MSLPVFHRAACHPTLAEVIAWTGATALETADLSRTIGSVAPLDQARPGALTFLDNAKYAHLLEGTQATACLLARRYAERLPERVVALVVDEPYRAFAIVAGRLFPLALRPESVFGNAGISPSAFVHPEARLEARVVVDPGAVIGPRAEIGAGTVVGAHAVIGPDVRIGRECSIGPQCSVSHALLGNRVIIHPGARIGQDGFGFAMGGRGHLKVPQIGRVVIQDDVEIGANSTIDRGSNRDTLIGEGTKIDNLVQIGHNVTLGRHCVLVSQTGISGSTTLGDFVATGGQCGIGGHLTIGTGAQVGAKAGVMTDIPAGSRWLGAPAQPARDFFKLHATMQKLARRGATDKPQSAETASQDA